MEKVTSMPWGESAAKEDDGHEREVPPPRAEEVLLEQQDREMHETKVSDQEAIAREIYLCNNDFDKHGWTPGCAKCRFMVLHPNREGGPIHSEKCKPRMVKALRGTAAGRARIEQAERRLSEHIVRGIKNISGPTPSATSGRGGASN